MLSRLQTDSAFRDRVRHLAIRDVFTRQQVPLGIAEVELDPDSDDEDNATPAEQEYFADDYMLLDPPEPTLQLQIAAVRSAISLASIKTLTWSAALPMSQKIAAVLATKEIDVKVKLNPYAIDTTAWSWTPVLNRAYLVRLQPLASKLASLQLCLPDHDSEGVAMLVAVNEFLAGCPQLAELSLQALGRPCKPSMGPSDPHMKGVNGPSRALAQQANVADFNVWDTGFRRPRPNAGLRELFAPPAKALALPPSLTSLTLQHLCVCDAFDETEVSVPLIPTLRTLTLSCLAMFKAMAGALPRLQSLHLSLAESWAACWEESHEMRGSAACITCLPQREVTDLLLGLPSLQELQVRGNPEIASELALRYHGKSLKRLTLLHGMPYGRKDAYSEILHNFMPRPLRMDDLPNFASALGASCPRLEELSIDAPNASTDVSDPLAAKREVLTSAVRCFPGLHCQKHTHATFAAFAPIPRTVRRHRACHQVFVCSLF